MTNAVDPKGYFVLEKHVVVDFQMKEVSDLHLNGFSNQNVIFGLTLERIESGYRVTLEDCYGISGTIDATDVSIRLKLGKPMTSDDNKGASSST